MSYQKKFLSTVVSIAITAFPLVLSAETNSTNEYLKTMLNNEVFCADNIEKINYNLPETLPEVKIEKKTSINHSYSTILKELGLDKMTVAIDDKDIKEQSDKLDNKINFDLAFKLAMDSFMNDNDDWESPLALAIEDAYDVFDQEGNFNPTQEQLVEKGKEILFRVLNDPATTITLLSLSDYPPEGCETVSENWIFLIEMKKYSDHDHWAIVNRLGKKPVYNYGFN